MRAVAPAPRLFVGEFSEKSLQFGSCAQFLGMRWDYDSLAIKFAA
jgi:hypothetical protein